MNRHLLSAAPMFAAALTASAAALICAVAYVPADAAPRTVNLGIAAESNDPAAWTTKVITDGFHATSPADRARACKATPAQLRAAAPNTSYDKSKYDVETVIVVLRQLCSGR